MRADPEARVGKLGRGDFTLGIHQHVQDAPALLADKMLMAAYERIEMLRPTGHQDLQLFVGDELL